MEIRAGMRVQVRSANGELLPRIAQSGVEPGDQFPIVWVVRQEELEAARREDREPVAIPWPAEDVVLAEAATA